MNLHTLLAGMEDNTATLKNSLAVLKKYIFKHKFTIWPCYSTPKYLLKRIQNMPHKDVYVFIAALFIISKEQEKSICPSVGEWINKIKDSHTMEY